MTIYSYWGCETVNNAERPPRRNKIMEERLRKQHIHCFCPGKELSEEQAFYQTGITGAKVYFCCGCNKKRISIPPRSI